MRLRLLALAGLFAFSAATLNAESYDDKLALTDRKNPDSLYELVVWCKANKLHSSANKHIREILALDPNHAPTRELQGFVWTGKRWVHQSRMPKTAASGNAGAGSQAGAGGGSKKFVPPTGPAPTASDIAWDLSVPANPDTDGGMTTWLEGVVRDMNSPRKTSSWQTLMVPEQRAVGLIVLKKAIADGAFSNVQVPILIAEELIKEGNQREADQWLPFIMKASEKTTDIESLGIFAHKVGNFGDKRVVPRLMELISHADENVQFNTKFSLGQFMVKPIDQVTEESAKEWWGRFHAAPDSVVYAEALKNDDPMVQIKAITAITKSDWTNAVMPVLIELIQHRSNIVFMEATRHLKRITGTDWDIKMTTDQEKRKEIAGRLETWWEDNKRGYRPLYAAHATSGEKAAPRQPKDRVGEWIAQLRDVDANVSNGAMSQLRNKGDEVIPDLIARGLSANDGITRNRVRDLLREMTGQNFGFEGISGNATDRSAAIAKWQAWAQENGHGGDK